MNTLSQHTAIIKKPLYLFLAVLVCLICALCLSQGVRAELIPYSVEIPRDDFPVRSEPLDSSEIVANLNKGSLLYPEDKTGSWYKVPFNNGVYGYVHKDFVNAVDTTATVSLFPGAALKEGPDSTSETLAIYSKNTEVKISYRDGNWCQVIAYNSSVTGYMSNSSVTPVNKVIYNSVDSNNPASYLTVVTNTANVRSDAGTSYSIVTTVSYGAQLTNLGTKLGTDGYTWYYVSTTSGQTGYIRGDLVTALTLGSGLAGKTIVVDPGHGSYKSTTATTLDSGAVGPSGVKEKDVNLRIALALKSYLEADGAKVIMTRTKDVGVMTLTARAQVANNNNADMFSSIHCNSSTSSSAHGTETFYSVVDEYNSTISDALKNQRNALAKSVQTNIVAQLQRSNRGVKTENFTVITKSKMPAVLVETAFISNPTEERLLNSASFQDSAAKGCYLGIRGYFN